MLAVAWFTGTVFFLICYNGPCHKLPPALQLKYFEVSGEDQDIYAGVDLTDSRGLRYFPRLWCCPEFPCALQGSGCLCSRVSGMGFGVAGLLISPGACATSPASGAARLPQWLMKAYCPKMRTFSDGHEIQV